MNAMMIVFIAGVILIAVILVLNSGQTKVITTGTEQKNAITVSGTAKLEVEPDQVEIYVKIETFDEKAENAKNENAKVADRVIKALKRQGIKDDDIETTSFFLNPKYRYDRNKNENILQGYTLTNVLKVTTKDVDDAGKIIDTAVDNGANGIDRVSFGLSKEKQKEVSGEALIRAAEVAKDKAESLASSLGINLGEVVSIQESQFDFIKFDYAPRLLEAAVAETGTEIIPGKVEVSARVTLSYEIR